MKTNMIVWMVFRPLRPSALDERRLALEGLMISGVSRLRNLQCRLLIPALIAWAARAEYTTARLTPPPPHFRWHGRIYDVTTYHSFDSQATRFIDVFRLFLDMSFMGVCTTRHSQTPSRLMQELNICTIADEPALITFEQLIKGQLLYNDAFP